MKNKNLRNKILIYGGNYFGKPLGNLVNLNLGNPYGAISFGALDIVSKFSDKLRSSKALRLLKAGGFVVYGASAISDLVSFANGEYLQITRIPFDASMAYQLGKDTLENYKEHSFIDDIKGTGKYLSNKLSNLGDFRRKRSLETKFDETDGINQEDRWTKEESRFLLRKIEFYNSILEDTNEPEEKEYLSKMINLTNLPLKDVVRLNDNRFSSWATVIFNEELIQKAERKRI